MPAGAPHPTGWGKGLTPGQIALWSAALGGVGGFVQGKLLYDEPRLIALKTGLGALGSAGLGYGLAKLNPLLQGIPGFEHEKLSSALEAYAEGYFEVLERRAL